METALLAVAHGSSDPAAEGIARAIVAAAGGSGHVAFLEHAQPRPADVLDSLAAAGIRRVVVLPLLLSHAGHARDDIATLSHPDMQLIHGRALGPHPLLDDIVADRLLAAGVPPEAAVLLAAAGTRDARANAAVATTAQSMVDRGLAATAAAGFASLTEPTITQAAAALRRPAAALATGTARGEATAGAGTGGAGAGTDAAADAKRDVAFVPYFLSWGRLSRAAVAASAPRWVAEPLGGDPRLGQVLRQRYREALLTARQPRPAGSR